VGWEAWFTVCLVLLLLILLIRGVAPPDMILWGGAVLLALMKIITPAQAISGLANPAVATVGGLFVISAAMRETGALDALSSRALGRAGTERLALLRMIPQVSVLSAFLNNTAVVAMLMPAVSDWCRRFRVSPSRMLIPLSYLSILGGLCTLIGTSTNLVVNGQMREAGITPPMAMFELAWVGVPLVVIGSAYLLLFAKHLLPDRRDLLESFSESSRSYLVEMQILTSCALAGKSVQAAGLRQLPGLFLIEIVREGRIIAPVEPDETLLADDRLTFTGVVSTIVDLERIPGFVPVPHDEQLDEVADRRRRRYCEAVISATSPLIGKNIRDSNFRALYNAAVLAVHRGGARLKGRIGDIVLRGGDTLLLQSGPNFALANRNNPDFYLVSSLEEARPVRHDRGWIAIGLLLLLIVLLSSGRLFAIPEELSVMLIAGMTIMTRCISPGDARRTVQWDILLTIAAAFAIGAGLRESGAAAALAHTLISTTGAWGPYAALAAILVVTILMTEFITNNAAAVLVFPIAIAIADQLQLDPRPFIFGVTYAASASFATPIGYQTNLMVYGPGGYRFSDFLRVGLPMDLLMMLTAFLLIPLVWPFQPAAP